MQWIGGLLSELKFFCACKHTEDTQQLLRPQIERLVFYTSSLSVICSGVKVPHPISNNFLVVFLILMLGSLQVFSTVQIIRIGPIHQEWPLVDLKDMVTLMEASKNQQRRIQNTKIGYLRIFLIGYLTIC